ncbi:damage inducible protein Din [Acrasis kona]|uniref:Damage inducible protein Din n=1 Tax=Acrasis kona TaxID=1008807 RepID=A0AAW2YV15_9EUKA
MGDLSLKSHFIRMATYNSWAFKKLYDSLECVTQEKYKEDAGLYFKSIHGTLVHLFLSSKLWYHRLTGIIENVETFTHQIESYWTKTPEEWEEAVKDRLVLRDFSFKECILWIDYVNTLLPEQFEQKFTYTSTDGEKVERNRSICLDHIFNHFTHHRGQITAAITKLYGRDSCPCLDLTMMDIK